MPVIETKHLGSGGKVGLVVLALIVSDWVCTFLYLSQVNRYAAALKQVKSDVAIVLFADFGEAGLGPETLRRVDFTAKKFKEGAFDYIVCAGGARPRRNLYGSERMRQWFLAAGIPPERVFLDNTSKDTRSNLREGLTIAKERGWRTAWVVSSPLHIFRVKEITRKRSGSLSIFPAAYSYGDCHPSVERTTLWWQTHYEWGVWLLQRVLPVRMYEKVLDFLRGE